MRLTRWVFGYGTSSGLLLPDHPGKKPSEPEARDGGAGMQSSVADGAPELLPVEIGLADTFLPALFLKNSPVGGRKTNLVQCYHCKQLIMMPRRLMKMP